MKVLDLCAGTGSATVIFAENGHDVHGIELATNIPPVETAGTIHTGIDVRKVAEAPAQWCDENIAPGWRPDVIWSGTPCEGFSVAAIGRHWLKDGGGKGVHVPKHETSRLGLELLGATVAIIEALEPRAYFIENPCGMMRSVMPVYHPKIAAPQTVSYCQYGPILAESADPPAVWARKDTDIFSNVDIHAKRCTVRGGDAVPGPGRLPFIPDRHGLPCHEKAQRGAKAGVQRIPSNDPCRSKHPREFAESIYKATLEHFSPAPRRLGSAPTLMDY